MGDNKLEENDIVLKSSETNRYVMGYLNKCYNYLNASVTKIEQLKADGSFTDAALAKYKANQTALADECMNKALQILLWQSNNMSIVTPDALTDDEIDKVNIRIRSHYVKVQITPDVVRD